MKTIEGFISTIERAPVTNQKLPTAPCVQPDTHRADHSAPTLFNNWDNRTKATTRRFVSSAGMSSEKFCLHAAHLIFMGLTSLMFIHMLFRIITVILLRNHVSSKSDQVCGFLQLTVEFSVWSGRRKGRCGFVCVGGKCGWWSSPTLNHREQHHHCSSSHSFHKGLIPSNSVTMKSASNSRNPLVMNTMLDTAKKTAPTSTTHGSQSLKGSNDDNSKHLLINSAVTLTQNMLPASDPARTPRPKPRTGWPFGK